MEALKSRKLWVSVGTVLLMALNRKLGLNLSDEALLGMAATAGSYAVGQGFADSKKGAK